MKCWFYIAADYITDYLPLQRNDSQVDTSNTFGTKTLMTAFW